MGGAVASVMCARAYMGTYDHPDLLAIRNAHRNSVEIQDPTEPAEDTIYTAYSSKDLDYNGLFQKYYYSEYNSLAGLFKEKMSALGDKNVIGWRKILKTEMTLRKDETGKEKKVPISHMGETNYMTATQALATCEAFGAGLKAINAKEGDTVGIYESTRPEWILSAYGIWSQQLTAVTVYANLGPEALVYAMKEASVNFMVCKGSSITPTVAAMSSTGTPPPVFIYLDDLPVDANVDGLTVYKWEEVVEKGAAALKEGSIKVSLPASPDEIAMIMYTSGTTGNPKGVMLSHGNLYAAVKGLSEVLMKVIPIEDVPNTSYVAYLPLAHIFELSLENMFLLNGSLVGFGSPQTLTSVSCVPHGDLEEFRPTLVVGVPRIFDGIKKAIEANIPSGIKRTIFNRAFADRLHNYKQCKYSSYWDDTVFSKARNMMGGKVSVIISGGGALSCETQEFMSVIMGCFLGQGYGLTETCACGSVQDLWDITGEEIGPIEPHIQVKLMSVEGFECTKENPKGEIWIRGPVVAKGYYKQEEKTKEVFVEGGWFKTGDVGAMTERGTLKIVGRVKALAKNGFGEYIALDALESIYNQNELSNANGVCICVKGTKNYIVAIISTNEKVAMKFAHKHHIKGQWPDILLQKDFKDAALKSYEDTARKHNIKSYEFLKQLHFTADEWTPESGYVTAVHKLKRYALDQGYKKFIDELFTE
eukprot:Tbor_TRINITY_DN4703_c0_g1::TRINITY_DN4703_c0_g1_i2::g.17052::m.17052/K01897/ACSL, fadD; long-chain acyl-CoA synthetase